MNYLIKIAFVLTLCAATPVQALDWIPDWDVNWKKLWPLKGKIPPSVQIDDPYIDIRSGPGRGFPIFYSADKGDWIEILKRKTDWYKVRTTDGTKGWVHFSQLVRTLEPTGEKVLVDEGTQESFKRRRWEAGFFGGDLENAPLLSVYGSWVFTKNLGLELSLTESLGYFSDSLLGNLGIVHQPFPHWRYSPFITIGAGQIKTDPAATLVQTEDRQDETVHVGTGVKIYLTRSFMFRVDYRNYVVLTSREENEEIEEWKAGFAAFW